MRTKLLIAGLSAVVGVGSWLAGTAAPVEAHHAFAAEFDADRPVEFTGRVTRVEWVNPHVWIHLDVEEQVDWDEVRELVLGSYRHFALKRMLKALDAGPA